MIPIFLVLCSLLFSSISTVQGQSGLVVVQAIRLENGPNLYTGRVEVQVNGTWGTVCDDDWDDLDASVVCKMLGYLNGGKGLRQATYGQGTGPILLDDVNCDGSEQRIDQCKLTPISNCLHSEDAGVQCDPNRPSTVTARTTSVTPPRTVGPVPDNCQTPATNVRLVSKDTAQPGIGFVEVLNGNTWGSVCDDFFDLNAAKVVCGMLCYDRSKARPGAPGEVDLGSPRLAIILDDVKCVGSENQIHNCPHKPWNQHDCAQTEVARVTCVDLRSAPPDPPVPILQCPKDYLIALFSRARDRLLEEKHLTVANPFSGSCSAKKETDNNYVTMRIPLNECGTTLKHNASHLIYENVIKYAHTRQTGLITRVNTYMVKVSCIIPRRDEVTRNIEPLTEVVTQKATGRFIISMTFYLNNSFTQPVSQYPVRIPLGEWLNVALQLDSVDKRLKLVVPDCKATPTANKEDPVNYPLFKDGCRNEPTLGFFPLSQIKFGYRYQPFKFVNNPQIFIHCGAFVCVADDTGAECDRSCNSSKAQPVTPSGRRRRDVTPPREKHWVNSGPVLVYKFDDMNTVTRRVDAEPVTVSIPVTLPMTTTSVEAVTSSKIIQHTVSDVVHTTTETMTKSAHPKATSHRRHKRVTSETTTRRGVYIEVIKDKNTDNVQETVDNSRPSDLNNQDETGPVLHGFFSARANSVLGNPTICLMLVVVAVGIRITL